MSIEFRCTQCNKLLRTSDNTAGKQAKCPECGTVLTIPSSAPEAQGPAPGPAAASPFAGGAAPAAGVDAENPYASPSQYAAMPGPAAAVAGEITAGRLDFSETFSRSWEIFKQQWGIVLGMAIVAWLIAGFGFALLFYVPMIIGAMSGSIFVLVMFFVCGYVAGLAFLTWIMAGVLRFLLTIGRGQPPNLADIFSGGPYFVKVFLTGLLISLITFGVILVCMLPAILASVVSPKLAGGLQVLGMVVYYVVVVILSLMFSQAYFLIVDRNVGVIESLQISTQVMRGNKLMLFAIWLVMGLLMLVSVLPCGLGLFVTIPYAMVMGAMIYLTVTGQPTGGQLQPQQAQM